MTPVRSVLAETRHQLRVFRRTKISAFFTLGFPLFFFLIFNLLMGDDVLEPTGLTFAQVFSPGIAVFAMVTAGYTNNAIGVAIDRDEGILKRIRATPLSPAVYLAGRVIASVIVGLGSVALMMGLAAVAFDAAPVWHRLPAVLGTLLLGAAASTAMGLAVAGATPNAQAAPVVANITVLPVLFISGVFFPLDDAPRWLVTMADLLPLKPLTDAVRLQWLPGPEVGLPWRALAVLTTWLLIGLSIAIKTFTWDPRPGGRRRGAGG